ncbi:MAG: M15 family metallopeptidase [Bacilli bacterium]|nr:M15 family metallopeptidase [Bacilli bacterium]
MKKYLAITLSLIIILSILCLIKKDKKETIKEAKKVLETTPLSSYSFYKEENLDRYKSYKIKFPTLKNKDIILRVNIGLDHGFYTETKEITEFNILMLINKYNYVTNTFIPNDLVLVESFSKEDMFLNRECKDAFIKMAHDAEALGYNIRAISTYRTIDYQENLYNNYVKNDGLEKADTYSARPGYSEHHTGLAIDIDNKVLSFNNFENTKEFNWMMDNAYKYGFILRYPKDSSITGYIYEPWHYRYVGLEVANYIHEHNITFEEYYYEFIDK